MTDLVLYQRHSGEGGDVMQITLNRPKALNALTHEMIQSIYQNLINFEKDESVKAVFVDANSEKAFCAGGDVRSLYEKGKAKDEKVFDFFKDEYQLNALTFHYKKPYIAFLDGITMGGGVGLSMHGLFPILTPKTRFAMPETSIGFCPDVGGAYLLNKIDNALGLYLGLSGQAIKGNDAYAFGLSPFHLKSEDKESFFKALLAEPFEDNPFDSVTSLLNQFFAKPESSSFKENFDVLKNHFSQPDIKDIFKSLALANDELSQKTLATLNKKSPLSLAVVFEQFAKCKDLSLEACLELDYQLVQAFLAGNDFYEGVRALLIDKDNTPKWQHASIDAVHPSEIEPYFTSQAQTLVLS